MEENNHAYIIILMYYTHLVCYYCQKISPDIIPLSKVLLAHLNANHVY